MARLLRQLVFQLFGVQLAGLASETFLGDGTGTGEVEIGARSRVEFRPAGQVWSVGVAGFGEVGPLLLHGRGHLPVALYRDAPAARLNVPNT